MIMIIAKSTSKLALLLTATIGLLPHYAMALDCYLPPLSEKVQPTIDNPQTSAIVRGKLVITQQKYRYNRGFFVNIPIRSSYGTINGFIATAAGFDKPISVKVELKEDCNRWPDIDLCAKNENIASSVEAKPSIYFLDKTKNGYVLASGDCSMNSMEANSEDIAEIAACFINGGC